MAYGGKSNGVYGIMTAILGICLLFAYPVAILSIIGIGIVAWFLASNWLIIKEKFIYAVFALVFLAWVFGLVSGIARW